MWFKNSCFLCSTSCLMSYLVTDGVETISQSNFRSDCDIKFFIRSCIMTSEFKNRRIHLSSNEPKIHHSPWWKQYGHLICHSGHLNKLVSNYGGENPLVKYANLIMCRDGELAGCPGSRLLLVETQLDSSYCTLNLKWCNLQRSNCFAW